MVFKRDPREDLTSIGASPFDLESKDDAKDEAESKAPDQLPGGRKVIIVLATATLILILFPFLELDPRYPDASKGLSVVLGDRSDAAFSLQLVAHGLVSALWDCQSLFPCRALLQRSILSLHRWFFSRPRN